MKMHKLPWKCCKCANNFICRLYVVVLSVLVQAYRQTDRLADKQTDRQAGRQTNKQAERRTNRQLDRQAGRQVDGQAGRQAGR